MLRRILSGTVAILFVLTYTGPVMLCGEACAGMDAPMSCCSAQTDTANGSLSHRCCCDLTDGNKEAVPPSVPATNHGTQIQKSSPAVNTDYVADAASAVIRAGAAPIHTNTKPPPIYKQTCSYIC